jgi:hypothetical protein
MVHLIYIPRNMFDYNVKFKEVTGCKIHAVIFRHAFIKDENTMKGPTKSLTHAQNLKLLPSECRDI